jgi:hypothetical protein
LRRGRLLAPKQCQTDGEDDTWSHFFDRARSATIF